MSKQGRFKRWLSRFLEAYAREKLTDEINRLTEQNTRLQQQIDKQQAYVAGLRESLRAVRRITIRNEVK